MHRFIPSLLFVAVSALLVLPACGPEYPNCDKDDHCKEHGEVCVNKQCRECRESSQCNQTNACMACSSENICEKRPGCCTTNEECSPDRCLMTGGGAGHCGQCQADSHCPAGQRCQGERCVPAAECVDGDNSTCPPGHKCVGGRCEKADCQLQPVLFDFNEYRIRLDQEPTASANAECMNEKGGSYRLEGHCDERGSDEYNLALGQRRAGAVAKQYGRLGVKASTSTISYGEERPTCTQSNESCWSQNRRTETVPR